MSALLLQIVRQRSVQISSFMSPLQESQDKMDKEVEVFKKDTKNEFNDITG